MSEYIFKLPDLGEGSVESEIGEWFIKVGDDVAEEDIVGTVMTDKAAVEVSSPISGKVLKLAGEPGDMIPVGAPLVVFETGNGADTGTATGATADAAVGSAAGAAAGAAVGAASAANKNKNKPNPQATSSRPGRVMTSPAIRLRAKEAGIDLAKVPGTGPGGRITRRDFDAFVAGNSPASAPQQPARETTPASKEIRVIGLRRKIAERMTAAVREIPHFTYVEEVDVTELEALRRHLNDASVAAAARLTLLPFLGLALIRALNDFPQCNATYDKDRNVLLQHGAVHLGIATQTRDGLKVPVVHDAQNLGLEALGSAIRRITDAARDNSIRREQLGGSTITITSLGKLGGVMSTPVINQPEVGIVGINRAVDRPVVHDGQITVRRMMNLSSSFDHRFVDGYDAAAMIQRLRDLLEHPATIFI